jgi:hypothetical protein
MNTRWFFTGLSALVLVLVAVYCVAAAGPEAPKQMPGMHGPPGGPPACCAGMNGQPTNPDVARTFATVEIVKEYMHQRGKPFETDQNFTDFVRGVNAALK